MPKWKKCSDEKPEWGMIIWVSDGDGVCPGEMLPGEYFDHYEFFQLGKITHWAHMTLPKPPGEKHELD